MIIFLCVASLVAVVIAFGVGVTVGSERQWIRQDTYWEAEAYQILQENRRLRLERDGLSLRVGKLERERHE